MRVPSRRSVTPVRDTQQDITGVERDRLLVQLQVLHDAQQRLRFGRRLHRAVLTQTQRQRMTGAHHLQLGAAVLLRAHLAVQESEEAAAGALVENRGVEAL
ncbi:hypothetical protein GCM10020256_18640 [Streptomyces thermocoprophilus]